MSNARLAAAVCVAVSAAVGRSAEPADSPEFFEKKIRPVLVEHCFKCHGDLKGKAPKGGLRADSRAGLLKGGDNGPAIVPGDPDESRLIAAVRYQNPDLQMPPKGKLADGAIADLTAWVKAGANWPAGATDGAIATSQFDLAKRKREHWAWQPVHATDPPPVKDASWPRGPVDRFVLARLEEKGLKPTAAADRRVWIRRVTFDLIGLPPTPAEIDAFLNDQTPDAFATVVERLLRSPHFGERWGRHWLDLVRYAETRGHEFDAQIPQAYQYRDYVIRALNADVPYDRLVQEHIAGDLLTDPRRHPTQGFNESILATGFWFLGEEVHSPVDIRQDQADRFDNRIDVLGKAFLGLTIACARCHDHKFDAIGTKDYYALYGIVESSAYRQVRFDTLEHNQKIAAELDDLSERSAKELAAALARSAETDVRPTLASTSASLPEGTQVVIDYATSRPEGWLPDDASFGTRPRRPGDLVDEGGRVKFVETAAATYDRVWDVLAIAAETESDYGALGKRPRGGRTIRTPAFKIDGGKLQYLVKGAGTAYAAVDQHTLISGPLHGSLVLDFPASSDFRWVTHDLTPYQGHQVHVEFTPAKDSDFAITMVVQAPSAPPVPVSDSAAARDARLANARLERADDDVKKIVADFLAARERIAKRIRPTSRLAPAIWEGNGVDEHVFIRGSPKGLGEGVPRRFLEALGGREPITSGPGSGRLELARQMTDPANPLGARVIVNRVWHHLLGRGIVASVDNFGVLGERPTHPELLDFLADRFARDGWSLKRLVRDLVLSSTYRMATRGDSEADAADPQNLLLHRMRLRRLEGEAIRDAMLAVSGRLDRTPFGPPIPIHLTPFLEGRGRPSASGPLDGNGRRSVYLAVRRNFLNPFLLAFDTPIPFSTVGRRQVSNVPAQALILLNDPFVHDQARIWAKKTLNQSDTPAEKVRGMYLSVFGREPMVDETAACLEFLETQAERHKTTANDLKPWADLAHTLFNTKEFIYVD
jgi:cytochrome c553